MKSEIEKKNPKPTSEGFAFVSITKSYFTNGVDVNGRGKLTAKTS